VLRVENKAELVPLKRTFWTMFGARRYGLQIGRKIVASGWTQEYLENLLGHQANRPMPWIGDGNRKLWMFHDRFYWDDEDLEQEDVQALLLQRERRQQQKLQSAHSLMRAEEAGQPTRTPIPTDLRRVVFELDGGKWVECGGRFDLQYDHILPVALGGGTTVENLQLLCADCNRSKSDSI
jgi:5-methylcytosine-specific restriction endonuclease McrA